tara:strand:- start:398 stop:526 length:129 start_codon:yes stop_codon:yes gene_type:complete
MVGFAVYAVIITPTLFRAMLIHKGGSIGVCDVSATLSAVGVI